MSRHVSGDEDPVRMSPGDRGWCDGVPGVYCDSPPPDQGREVTEAREELRLWLETLSSGTGDTATITQEQAQQSQGQDTHTRMIITHTLLRERSSIT